MKLVALTLCLFILKLNPLQGQDLHFSNNKFSPLLFNPAQSGLFNNTLRVGVNIRDQFRSFIPNPYQSASFWIDSPVIYGLKDTHWLGLGIYGFADKVGDVGQQTSGGSISAAYHMGLDKKYKRILSVGLQLGSAQRKFTGDPRFGDGENSADLALVRDENISIANINVGVVYKQQMSKRKHMEIGVALINANNPSFSNSNVFRPVFRRINVESRLFIQTKENFTWIPTVAMSFIGKAYNIQLQCFSEIEIDKKKKISLTPGLGYRVGDAAQIHLGGIYNQWHVGISYDVTLSSASAYNQFQGGLEIGVIKYIDIAKEPDVDPVIFCPRL